MKQDTPSLEKTQDLTNIGKQAHSDRASEQPSLNFDVQSPDDIDVTVKADMENIFSAKHAGDNAAIKAPGDFSDSSMGDL